MKAGRPKNSDKKDHEKWKIVFIAELHKNYCHVGLACSLAGVSRETAYAHRKTDKIFRRAWKDAKNNLINDLERAAFKRATKGVREVTEGDGWRKVKRVYSDSLVIPLLKAHKKKYRNADKNEGEGKQPISIGPIIVKPE